MHYVQAAGSDTSVKDTSFRKTHSNKNTPCKKKKTKQKILGQHRQVMYKGNVKNDNSTETTLQKWNLCLQQTEKEIV